MCKFRTLLINTEQNADDISIVDMTMNIKCNGFSSIQNLYLSSSRANFLLTYRGIEGNAANKVMELTCDDFIGDDLLSLGSHKSGIKLVGAEEFEGIDPVDGSTASKHGLILSLEYPNGDNAHVVFAQWNGIRRCHNLNVP